MHQTSKHRRRQGRRGKKKLIRFSRALHFNLSFMYSHLQSDFGTSLSLLVPFRGDYVKEISSQKLPIQLRRIRSVSRCRENSRPTLLQQLKRNLTDMSLNLLYWKGDGWSWNFLTAKTIYLCRDERDTNQKPVLLAHNTNCTRPGQEFRYWNGDAILNKFMPQYYLQSMFTNITANFS